MFRSLHMKLVLIMTLLIVSLMTIVGAFLVNSVVAFYVSEFYENMHDVFTQQFRTDLATPLWEGDDQASQIQQIKQILDGSAGKLGVDGQNRNYFLRDGETGAVLASYNSGILPAGGEAPGGTDNVPAQDSYNLFAALNGEIGDKSDVTQDYMDLAVPFTRGDTRYIVQIYDNREAARSLNTQLIELIIKSLGFALVISVLLSFLLSKTMITPIENLTEGAERVAEGDFSYKIAVASRDEIGVLTGTFNAMARQLQETLQEVENERNKLNTLFIHMTDGVVAFARDGLVIHSNPAAADMLGREIVPGGSETYGSLFGDIAPLYEVLAVEQPGYVEGAQVRDGRSLELLLAPFSGEAQGGVMAVVHDVTEQRRTENMRREFVANVSHELRTPLTNIRSYAETLVDNAGQIPADTEKSFLTVILNESDRMTHIVQDLLTLSRFDSGYNALKLASFSYEDAVRDVYNAVLMEAQRHGHRLGLRLESGLPRIVGDRERIVQVIMNVVSNAIKYTPDNGSIEISVGRQGRQVWMEVADNGIGIPPEDRPQIFERFYRVDKARSRESGGTGLGLSIAKEIIDRHQGRIFLVDRPGPGTTVRIELLVEGPEHG